MAFDFGDWDIFYCQTFQIYVSLYAWEGLKFCRRILKIVLPFSQGPAWQLISSRSVLKLYVKKAKLKHSWQRTFFTYIYVYMFLSDEGPMLETLDHTIRIGSTPTFLYFDLYLHSAYAAHYVYMYICLVMHTHILFWHTSPHIYFMSEVYICRTAVNS